MWNQCQRVEIFYLYLVLGLTGSDCGAKVRSPCSCPALKRLASFFANGGECGPLGLQLSRDTQARSSRTGLMAMVMWPYSILNLKAADLVLGFRCKVNFI